MSDEGLTRHPSPQRQRTGRWQMAFALWGGPAAWYAQLNINYALMSTPCFPGPERNLELPAGAQWTHVTAAIVYVVLLLVALAAGFLSVRLFRRVGSEEAGNRANVEEAGTGRTRFLTYWGMLMGFGFALVIFVNAAALIMVPPCAD